MSDTEPSRQMTWDELLAERNKVVDDRDRLKAERCNFEAALNADNHRLYEERDKLKEELEGWKSEANKLAIGLSKYSSRAAKYREILEPIVNGHYPSFHANEPTGTITTGCALCKAQEAIKENEA